MYVPNFDELLDDDSCRILLNPNILDYFPNSFREGLCMGKKDIYFPSMISGESYPTVLSGVIINSVPKTNSSISKQEYIGLTILSFGVDRNFLTPFYVQPDSKTILFDSVSAMPTSCKTILGVKEFISSISRIDRISRKSSDIIDCISRNLFNRDFSKNIECEYKNLDEILYTDLFSR